MASRVDGRRARERNPLGRAETMAMRQLTGSLEQLAAAEAEAAYRRGLRNHAVMTLRDAGWSSGDIARYLHRVRGVQLAVGSLDQFNREARS